MADRAIAVQTLQIQSRGTCVPELARVDMVLDRRAIRRDVVGDELTKEWPTGRALAKRFRRVGDIAAVAQPSRSTERSQKRLVGFKRRQSVRREGVGSCRRSDMILTNGARRRSRRRLLS